MLATKTKNNGSHTRRLWILLTAAALLQGCVTTGSGSPLADAGGPRYSVRVSAPSATLQDTAGQWITETGRFTVASEEDVAQFTLSLDAGSTPRAANYGSYPKIVGQLRKVTRPSYYQLNYNLVDIAGKPVEASELVGIGKDQPGAFPALPASTTTPPADALADAMHQLQQKLMQLATTAPWRSPVMSQLTTTNQVIIAADDSSQLPNGATFAVEGQPLTRLKLVGYTLDNQHHNRALLALTAGTLPEPGALVVLITDDMRG